jgi:PAS domain S-box-containing protein
MEPSTPPTPHERAGKSHAVDKGTALRDGVVDTAGLTKPSFKNDSSHQSDRHASAELARALRESEAWLSGQKEAFQAAVNGVPLTASLGILIRTAIQQFGSDSRCAFYLADATGAELHHVTGMPETYARAVDGFKIGPESLACGLSVHRAEPVITADVCKEPRWKPWLWLAEEYGYRGCWSFPVESSAGQIVGTFAMYFKEPREASSRDRELATVLTRAASIVISRYREAEERARIETGLRESEQRFRALVTTTSDVVYRMSPDWREMRHLDGKNFIADTADPSSTWLEKYIYPADQSHVMAVIQAAIRSKATFELEHRVRRVDGSIGWTHSQAVPLLDEDGNIIEWFGAARDVTERKRHEEQLTEQARLLDLSNDAIIVRDGNDRIAYWNHGAEEIYGWSRHEALGKNFYELLQPQFSEPLDRILRNLRRENRWSGEVTNLRRDGQRITVASRWALDGTREGVLASILHTDNDVTQRKQAEDALKRSEKLAAVGRLAATMAHEINNPLESVTNLLYLARKDKSISQQARHYLQLASQELNRVAHVARQTLGFSRDNSAASPCDASRETDELLEVYSYRLRSREIELTKELKPVNVFTSAGEFRQVFSNLLINAVDAIPPSGGKIRVRVRPARNWSNGSRGVRITVADNGSGIEPSQRARIFEAFYTTKPEVGTGLGLWLSRSLVQKNNGYIRVRSRVQPDRSGTVFSVFWPDQSTAGVLAG